MLWSGPEVASSVIWTLLSTESREVLFGVGKSQDPSPQPQAEQVTCSSLRAQTSACSAAHSVLLGVVKEQQTQAFLRAGGNLYVEPREETVKDQENTCTYDHAEKQPKGHSW